MDDNKPTAVDAGIGTATDQQQVPDMATEQKNTESVPTSQEATPTETDQPPVKAAPKTYSQAEYDRMVKAQYEAGITATMKEAGYEPTRGADFKKQLAAFKKWQDDQKTDAEKASEAAVKTQGELTAALAKAEALERKMLALGLGIPAEKVATYVHMAAMYLAEGVDFEAALKMAIEAIPLPQPKEATPTIVLPTKKSADDKKAVYVPPKLI